MKLIEVICDAGHTDTIAGIAEQHGVTDYWLGTEGSDGRRSVRLLVSPDIRQAVLDAIQGVLATSENARIIVLPIDATLPKIEPEEGAPKEGSARITREELYNSMEKNTRLDSNYLLLVCLSTIVAAIGLLEDNVAVVIGAMVIAPLLGPNIALALATALGDSQLMWKALSTNIAGLALALLLSILIGMIWPHALSGGELLARTVAGPDSIALALASGAAAVLSLTTGLPSVLVGVMVAVALLPPAATMGLMLGASHFDLAAGAGLLLAVNIVCVNLSAKVVFLIRGVKPRTWLEQKKARQSMKAYLLFWAVSLGILVLAMLLRNPV